MSDEVTDPTALAERLNVLTQRLEVAVKTAQVGIYDCDLRTKTAYWSSELYGLLGLEPAEIAPGADTWAERLAPEDREVVRDTYRSAVANEKDQIAAEFRLLQPAGDPRWVRTNARLFYEGGVPVRALGAVVDIQDAKRRNEEQEQAARFAEQFVSILGHDLRNPLNAVTMGAVLLQRKANVDPGDARTVDRVLSSAERLNRMVDQLLDLTRGRLGGGIPVQRRATNLAQVVTKTVDDLRVSYPDRSVVLARVQQVTGDWDGDRLSQLVSTLVGNAFEHGDSGRPVAVELTADAHAATFVVQSYGPVIPEDVLAVLFDPFRRGARERGSRSKSLGLSLYIARQIVLAHRGQVRVTSSVEAGTRFEVTLPHDPRS